VAFARRGRRVPSIPRLIASLLCLGPGVATDDAVDFLKMVEKDVIKLHLQLAAWQITKEEFDDLMLDQKALAKMEALKQTGLTQAAIDQFVNGAINILLSAAISAIP
jgi:hypothetical protein